MISSEDTQELRYIQSGLVVGSVETHCQPPRTSAPDPERANLLAVHGSLRAAWTGLARADSIYRRWGCRALDLILLVVALPLALVVAIPIALINWLYFGRPGLILFTQSRVGRHGEPFQILKFRTLQVGAREDFESWIGGVDAERTTGLGRFLRSTHLDELPQLLNILAGQMSFVGPRPEMCAIHAWAVDRIPGFDRRLALRPGLTGLSQLTLGYTEGKVEAYRSKLARDLVWMRRRSFSSDVGLLLRTVPWSFRRRGGTAGEAVCDLGQEPGVPTI